MPIQKDTEFLILLGKRIKQLRNEKKISQAQLSFEADIQISQISRIERGLINTTIVNLNVISKILDVSLKELFDF
jgi:transcriptional regulator with XRE-family HTH domain